MLCLTNTMQTKSGLSGRIFRRPKYYISSKSDQVLHVKKKRGLSQNYHFVPEIVICRKQRNYHYTLSLVFNSSWGKLVSWSATRSWSRWTFALTCKQLLLCSSFIHHIMHPSTVISIQLAGQPAALASKQRFVPLLGDRPATLPVASEGRCWAGAFLLLDSVGLLMEATDQIQLGKACRRSSELMLFSSCLNINVCYLTEARKKKKGKKRTDLSSKHISLTVQEQQTL